jgi:amino-acid N-acetyltransferase
MNIIQANQTHRQLIIELLKTEKLPVEDLPGSLDHFLVAIININLVGVIGLEPYVPYGLLRSMVVREDYRGQNIASLLIQSLEKHATGLNIGSIYLLTETASNYFTKQGYTHVDRTEVPEAIKQSTEFSSVCPVSAIVMKKSL